MTDTAHCKNEIPVPNQPTTHTDVEIGYSTAGPADEPNAAEADSDGGEIIGTYLYGAGRGRDHLRKVHRRKPNGLIETDPLHPKKFFHAVPVRVARLNVKKLAALVGDPPRQNDWPALVRACFVGDGRWIRRAMKDTEGATSYLIDARSRLLILDIDGYQLPEGHDVVANTEEAILSFIVTELPECFHVAGWVFKHSASADLPEQEAVRCGPVDPFGFAHIALESVGNKKPRRYVDGPCGRRRLTGHLFMILDQPVTSAWLKGVMTALKRAGYGARVDETSNGANQLLLLAPPRFYGLDDPIEQRVHYHDGPTVSVDALAELRRVFEIAFQHRKEVQRTAVRTQQAATGAFIPPDLRWRLQLREDLSLTSQFAAIVRSAGSYAYFVGERAHVDEWKDGVRDALANTARTSEHRARYESDAFLNALYPAVGAIWRTAQASRPVALADSANMLLDSSALSSDADEAYATWMAADGRLRPGFRGQEKFLDFHIAREVVASHSVWATVDALVLALGGEQAVCVKRTENNGGRYALMTVVAALLKPSYTSDHPRLKRFAAFLAALRRPDEDLPARLRGCVYEAPDGAPAYVYRNDGKATAVEVGGVLLNPQDGASRMTNSANVVRVNAGVHPPAGLWRSNARPGDTEIRMFGSAAAAVNWLNRTGATTTQVVAVAPNASSRSLGALEALLRVSSTVRPVVDASVSVPLRDQLYAALARVEDQRRRASRDPFSFPF